MEGASELAATVTVTARIDSFLESIVVSILDLGFEHRLRGVMSGPLFGRRVVRSDFGIV